MTITLPIGQLPSQGLKRPRGTGDGAGARLPIGQLPSQGLKLVDSTALGNEAIFQLVSFPLRD